MRLNSLKPNGNLKNRAEITLYNFVELSRILFLKCTIEEMNLKKYSMKNHSKKKKSCVTSILLLDILLYLNTNHYLRAKISEYSVQLFVVFFRV